ncbi:MAG: hypothetical protein M3371_15065 [Acidobacteriota bacterium]|nr:hypothetical protein [Acidobacteriota bacterium]
MNEEYKVGLLILTVTAISVVSYGYLRAPASVRVEQTILAPQSRYSPSPRSIIQQQASQQKDIAMPLSAPDQQNSGGKAREAGRCRPIDPSYVEISEATGGHTFILAPSELGEPKSLALSNAEVNGYRETVMRVSGKLAGGSQEFLVPVDTSIRSIAFIVFIECKDAISITLPSGVEAVPSTSGVEDNNFLVGRMVTVADPISGVWRVRVSGKGIYTAVAQAKTEVALEDFKFVKLGGRPGHEGYFPVKGMPRAGVEQKVVVRFSAPLVKARLRVTSSEGAIIQSTSLEKIAAGDASEGAEFLEQSHRRQGNSGWPSKARVPTARCTSECIHDC